MPRPFFFCFSFSHGGSSTRTKLAKTAIAPTGDVDEEDPAPVEVLDEVAAERRPQHRRHDGGDGGHREGGAALGGREGVEDDGLLVRLQPAAEEALEGAEHDELPEALRDAAQEREDREHDQADDEVALAADRVRQPARDRQHDAVGDEIGGQRVGGFVGRGRERAGDVGQRHVDDGGVQDLHEGRQRHRDGDEPGLYFGFQPPAAPASLISGSPWARS